MSFYTIKTIYPWLHSIIDPLSTCMYLLTGGKRALLYDTGYGIAPIMPVVRQITDLPLDVVLGHGHHDHVNGACQFDEVWIHEADKVLCLRHASRTARRRVLERMEVGGVALPGDFEPEAYINRSINELRDLKIGQVFDLGGLSAEVVGMEGHTAGSVGLLVRQKQTLLVSDAATPIMYMCLDESAPIDDYIAMLERTAALPFDTFFWGHEDKPMLKKDWFEKFANTAKNISVEKSEPFNASYGIKGLLYKGEEAVILFRPDKLKS